MMDHHYATNTAPNFRSVLTGRYAGDVDARPAFAFHDVVHGYPKRAGFMK